MLPSRLPILLVAAMIAGAANPSASLGARTIRLRMPSFVVPPHMDREVCTFVPVPMGTDFNYQKSIVVNVGVDPYFVSHHFLAWAYNGTTVDGFPKRGKIVDSKACLDFGPTDTNNRTLIVGAQAPRLVTTLGEGLAQQLTPTTSGAGKKVIGIILNSHWINSSARPKRAAVKLMLTA